MSDMRLVTIRILVKAKSNNTDQQILKWFSGAFDEWKEVTGCSAYIRAANKKDEEELVGETEEAEESEE